MEKKRQIVLIDDVGNRLKSNKMTDLMAKRDKIFHKLKRKWKNSCDSLPKSSRNDRGAKKTSKHSYSNVLSRTN